MKYQIFVVSLSFILFALTSGCSTSDVISSGPDTYMVTSSGAGFGTAGVRENVYQKANDFCAKNGLVMVPVSFKARPGELGRSAPSADLVFRALKPGDPAIGRPMLQETDQSIAVAQDIQVSMKDEIRKEKEADFYTEVMKLDDLRKRGLISDAEFEEAKRKLLQTK